MQRFPTPVQNITIDLAFDVVGESRFNRTQREYMDISGRWGPLKVLLYKINKRLRELHEAFGDQLPKICRFKAGDQRIVYEPYLWLLKTPERAEILEISAYPPYPCRHDHISFRPRFAALLPLS